MNVVDLYIKISNSKKNIVNVPGAVMMHNESFTRSNSDDSNQLAEHLANTLKNTDKNNTYIRSSYQIVRYMRSKDEMILKHSFLIKNVCIAGISGVLCK